MVSTINGSIPPSASAAGDSCLPIISADGRYVLYQSTANNLVPTNGSGPSFNLIPRQFNVYVSDRLTGSNTLVSVNLAGDGANADSTPMLISTNGRYVLFSSIATDLVTNKLTSYIPGIYVRDRVAGTTVLVNVDTNGSNGNNGGIDGIGNSLSFNSAMTPDGRYVAFANRANNLVSNDTNGIPDIFLRDLQAGTTTLVSVGATKSTSSFPFNYGSCDYPAISADGRYVAFCSSATSLVPGLRLAGEVYVRDMLNSTTLWASTNARSLYASIYGISNAVSFAPAISADGTYVGFMVGTNTASISNSPALIMRYNTQTGVSDLVQTNATFPPLTFLLSTFGGYSEDIDKVSLSADGRFIASVVNDVSGGGNTDIALWDGQTGISTLVNVDPNNGLPVPGVCSLPTTSDSGQKVAFLSNATTLTTNSLADGTHLYVRDLAGATTQLIDVNTNGFGVGVDSAYSISTDDMLAAFDQIDGTLVANDQNGDYDVFVRDAGAGVTSLVSTHAPELPSFAPDRSPKLFSTSVSADGRYVAYASYADNLVANDTNHYCDVIVRDSVLGTNILASVATDGSPASGSSSQPAITLDGRYVAFASMANNLITGDTNRFQDIFVRDLLLGTNYLVSMSTNGGAADNYSELPQISPDGRYVLFLSWAKNLNGKAPSSEELYLRDMQTKTNYMLTANGAAVPGVSMSSNGRYIAYISTNTLSSTPTAYIWDVTLGRRIFTNSFPAQSAVYGPVAVSSDRHWFSWVVSTVTGLIVYDTTNKVSYSLVGGQSVDSRTRQQFSADGRFLVYGVRAGANYNIYLRDLQAATDLLVSRNYYSTNAANLASGAPVISPDGRFVAYPSYSSDIVPNDVNGTADVYLYDRISSNTVAISVNRGSTGTARGSSRSPVFTPDSQSLLFRSYATDLPGQSSSEYGAIFAMPLTTSSLFYTNGIGAGMSNAPAPFIVQLLGPTTNASQIINWPAVLGTYYQVQYKTNLTDPNWLPLPARPTVIGGQAQAADTTAAPQRFYRVVGN